MANGKQPADASGTMECALSPLVIKYKLYASRRLLACTLRFFRQRPPSASSGHRSHVGGHGYGGRWSPVRLQALFRQVVHWTEHPACAVTLEDARRCNQHTNHVLLARLGVSVREGIAETGGVATANIEASDKDHLFG